MTGVEEQDKGPLEPALIVKGGPTDGYVFPLQAGMSVLVGSGRLAHLRVGTDEIGAAHIRITWDELGISVTDNGSATGTFVNGEPVETAVLWDGDHIAFAPPGTQRHLPQLLVRIPPGFVQAPPPLPPEPEVPTPRPAGPRPFVPRPARSKGGFALPFALPRISLPSVSLPRFDLRGPSPVLMAAAAGGALLLVVLVVVLQRLFFSSPVLATIQPERSQPGQTVTLSGKRFDENPAGNTVWFGDKAVPAKASSGATLAVVVPEGLAAGEVSVSVETARGRSSAIGLGVHAPLRVDGFEPEAALSGDEVTARGRGFTGGPASLTVAGTNATVVEARVDGLRFRVPELAAVPGSLVPVIVRVGNEASKPVDLVLGRLPVVVGVTPARGSPGERVVIRGRGFAAAAGANAVTFGGVPALVLQASPQELHVLAPPAGTDRAVAETEVVVRAGETASTNRAVFSVVRASGGAFVLRFFPAAASETGTGLAYVATAVGPLLLLGGPAGAPSVAERAIRVSAALNAAVDRAFGGQLVVFEAREQPSPGVGLRNAADLAVQATQEDAAAYGAPPGLAPQAGPPALAQLAEFWAALLNDYVSLFVTRERPVRVLALSPRGRTLTELRSALTGRGSGISAERVAALSPDLLSRLRETALLVPEQGQGVAVAAIEGLWDGEMQESGTGVKLISVRLRLQGTRLEGTLTNRTQRLSMDVPLRDVAFENGQLRFVLPVGTSARTFVGAVDGGSVSGTIHAQPGGPAVGRFSLRNIP